MENKETKIEYIGEQSSLDDLRKRIEDLEMNLGVLSPRNLAGIRRKDLRYATMPYLFGTGADGDLLLNSGTTTIDLQNSNLLIKNYKNLKITGDAKLQFSNPPDNGSIIIFNVLDTFELSSNSDPGIDLRGIGSKGGSWSYNINQWVLTDAKSPFSIFMEKIINYSISGQNGQNGGSGGSAFNPMDNGYLRTILAAYFDPFFLNTGINILCSGAGGGAGGCYNVGQPSGSGLNLNKGGRGAGTIIIRCKKLIFTGKINASGENGSNATTYTDGSYYYSTSGGGGGGSGGGVFIIYNDLISNSGEINVNGGNGGNGSCPSYTTTTYGGGGSGGTFYLFAKGGNGLSSGYANTYAQNGQNGLTGGYGGSGGFSPNCQSVSGAGGGGAAGEKLIIQNTIKF